MIRHAHSHSGFSSESIPLCQVNQPKSESPDNIVSINVPVISNNVNEKVQTHKRRKSDITVETKINKDYERLSGDDNNKLKVTDFNNYHEPKMKNHKKYLNSLENISDSIHNLLNCVPIYNFCQNKKNAENLDRNKRRKGRGGGGDEEEEEPLFFVGEKNLYCKSDDSKNVIHHYRETKLSPEESEMYENLLPQDPSKKPKRYSRSSLKKQKISLYDEKELDLYKKVPTEKPETPKPKTLTPAEIKRKTFLRKISLQDTYLNYNQDYWLDFEKTGRFHRSIDLGYFGADEEEKKEKKEKKEGKAKKSTGPKPKITETISEKSNETELNNVTCQIKKIQTRQSDLPSSRRNHKSVKHFSRRDSEPLMIRNKKCSCNNCGNKVKSEPETKTVAEIISELTKTEQRKSWFILPSNENIPLFYERNGHIETDFDMINDLLDEDCLIVDRIESSSPVDEFILNEDDGLFNDDSDEEKNNQNNNNRMFDISDFCEIKLNSDDNEPVCVDNVKRSSVFNFQGGQAFFGENRISTSEESDVFLNETEVVGVTFDKKRGFPVPIVSVSTPSKSPSPEMS